MLGQQEGSLVLSVSHERACAGGGARMFSARGSISTKILAAPQCWHTNVGTAGRCSLWGWSALHRSVRNSRPGLPALLRPISHRRRHMKSETLPFPMPRAATYVLSATVVFHEKSRTRS